MKSSAHIQMPFYSAFLFFFCKIKVFFFCKIKSDTINTVLKNLYKLGIGNEYRFKYDFYYL